MAWAINIHEEAKGKVYFVNKCGGYYPCGARLRKEARVREYKLAWRTRGKEKRLAYHAADAKAFDGWIVLAPTPHGF